MGKNIEEVSRKVSEFLNSSGTLDLESFCIHMLNKEHPCIHQVMTKLCVMWLVSLADSGISDERNRYAVMFAQEAIEVLGRETLESLPIN